MVFLNQLISVGPHIVLDDWIMFGGLLVSMVVASTSLVLWISMCVVLWHFFDQMPNLKFRQKVVVYLHLDVH